MFFSTPSVGKALIVAPLRIHRVQLRHALVAMQYDVMEVLNGAEALRHLDRTPFDVVFVNGELPGEFNGEHIARHLHTMPDGADTLLISLTPQAGSHACLGCNFDLGSVKTALAAARDRLAATKPPIAVTRIHKALAVYATSFPGGMPEALRHCREELTAENNRLLSAAAAHRWADARRAANNLGDLGAMVGLPELHRAARAAETALRNFDRPSLPQTLSHTNRVVAQACAALNAPNA